MLLQPKSIKYKKVRKGKIRRLEFKSNQLKFGTIGLKTTTSGLVTARQIESARQSIARKLSRRGKLWVRVYPSLPITAKPSEVRMGKGKGMVNHWAARVKAGQILFEVCGVENPLVIQAFRIGGAKLSVKTIICH